MIRSFALVCLMSFGSVLAHAGSVTVFKGGEWTCTAESRGGADRAKNPLPDGPGYRLVYSWVGDTAVNSRQVLTYKDGRELIMVRNNSGFHVNEGGTFKLTYDAAYADIDALNEDYSKVRWHLAVGIAQGQYVGMDFVCEGRAQLVQKPYRRFSCETDEMIFEGKDRARYKLTFAVANMDDDALVSVLSYAGSDEEDMPIRVKPMNYVVASLNENLAVGVAKNGDVVIRGDSDGVYWSQLRLRSADGFTKGTLSFEGEYRGNRSEDRQDFAVTCKVRN